MGFDIALEEWPSRIQGGVVATVGTTLGEVALVDPVAMALVVALAQID